MRRINAVQGGCWVLGLITCLITLAGCHRDMWDQPRIKPFARSEFFRDELAARPPVPHTVARGTLRLDEHFYTGKVNGKLVDKFPFPITQEVLKHGQTRYNIYCSPCHGLVGDGKGFVALRGQWIKPPASFHEERLRTMPIGHFYDVMTNGFGIMLSYASRIPPEDRWAIAAYIRALQLSQQATMAEVPTEELQKLMTSSEPTGGGGTGNEPAGTTQH